jgi:N-acetylmuramic acid 6-phosphate (MurNAc-6-P) etherase
LLDLCGDVKTAIVAHHARVSPEMARERLARHANSVRRALEETK